MIASATTLAMRFKGIFYPSRLSISLSSSHTANASFSVESTAEMWTSS